MAIIDIRDRLSLDVHPFDDKVFGLCSQYSDLALNILCDLLLERWDASEPWHLNQLIDLLQLLPKDLTDLFVVYSRCEASKEVNNQSYNNNKTFGVLLLSA